MKILKNIFYIMICCCIGIILPACNSSIPVASIGFAENVIEVVVGEEVKPTVLFVPTNSTKKTYTLKTNAPTIFTTDGNRVIGQAPGEGLLMATSIDGKKNATVRVVVYAEPVQLSAPTRLSYDGGKLIFNASPYANNYRLKINNEIYDIGNNTFFNNLPTGEPLYIQAMAVGNGRATLSSEYSEVFRAYIIPTPKDFACDEGVASWSAVTGVKNYKINIKFGTDEKVVTTDKLSLDLSEYFTVAGKYELNIVADADDFGTDKVFIGIGVTIFSSQPSKVVSVTKAKTPTNITTDVNKIVFDMVSENSIYNVHIWNETFDTTYVSNSSTFALPDAIVAGTYSVAIATKGVESIVQSEYSAALTFTRLSSPHLQCTDGKIRITPIVGADGYVLNINGQTVDIGSVTEYVLGAGYDAKQYNITVSAYSFGTNFISSSFSTDKLNVKKLSSANTLSVADNTLSFVSNETNVNYDIYMDGQFLTTTTAKKYTFTDNDFVIAKDYLISVVTRGGSNTLDSDSSATCTVTRLDAIKSVQVVDDVVSFASVSRALGYRVQFLKDGIVVLTETPAAHTTSIPFPTSLGAGVYSIKVNALGNGGKVIDGAVGSIDGIQKLAIPTLFLQIDNISWNADSKASGYIVYANDIATPISGNVFTFNGAHSAGRYLIKVRATGNGAEIVSSNVAEDIDAISIIRLGAPTNITLTDYKLSWDMVDDAKSYKIIRSDGTATTVFSNSYVFDEATFDSAENYTYTIQSLGWHEEGEIYRFGSVESEPYTIVRQGLPSGLKLDNNKIVWDEQSGRTYTLEINGKVVTGLTSGKYNLIGLDGVADTIFQDAGEYKIRVKYEGNGSNILSSAFSEYLIISKLDILPESARGRVYYSDSVLYWAVQPLASGYQIRVNDTIIDTGIDNSQAENGYLHFDILSVYGAGVYRISVRALGDGAYSFASDFCTEVSVNKMARPVLTLDNDIISWVDIPNVYKYVMRVYTSESTINYDIFGSGTTSFDIGLVAIDGETLGFELFAIAEGADFSTSEPSRRLNVYRLPSPNIFIDDGAILWDTVSYAQQYELSVDGVVMETFAGVGRYTMAGFAAGNHNVAIRAISKQNTVGDSDSERLIASSNAPLKIVKKLATPTRFALQDGYFAFMSVEGTRQYYINLTDGKMNEQVVGYVSNNNNGGEYCFNIQLPDKDLSGKEIRAGVDYTGRIMARGLSEYINSNYIECLRPASSEVAVLRRLPIAQNLRVEGDYIKWNKVSNASKYLIIITNYDVNGQVITHREIVSAEGENTTQLLFPIVSDEWKSGLYEIKIVTLGDSLMYFNSTQSMNYVATRLATPTNLHTVNGEMYWDIDSGYSPTGYRVSINNKAVVISGAEAHYKLPDTYSEGYYTFNVQALGNGSNILPSGISDVQESILMAGASNFSLSLGNLSFDAVNIFSNVNIKFVSTKVGGATIIKKLTKEDLTITRESKKAFGELYYNDLGQYVAPKDWKYTGTDGAFANLTARYAYVGIFSIPADIYNVYIELEGNNYTTGNSGIKMCILTSKYAGTIQVTKMPTPDISAVSGVVKWSVPKEYEQLVYDNPVYNVSLLKTTASPKMWNTLGDQIDFNEDNININGEIYDLTNGGNFSIYVSIIGDDTHLSSANSSSETVIILESLIITQRDGVILWSKMPDAHGYFITIYMPDGSRKEIAYDSNHTELDLSSNEYPEGAYRISFIAKGNGANVLDSKKDSTVSKTKLNIEDATFHLEAGQLQWKYVNGSNTYRLNINGIVSTLKVKDNDGRTNPQFTVIGDTIRYELSEDSMSGLVYNIKLQVVGDDTSYLSSSYSATISGSKLGKVEDKDFILENGLLKWSASQMSDGYTVRVIFTSNGDTIDALFDVSDKEFLLPHTVYWNNRTYQLAGNMYIISVKLKGDNSTLNSNYCTPKTIQRIHDVSGIKTLDGIIKWDESEGASGYRIVFIDAINGEKEIITYDNSFDAISSEDFDFSSNRLEFSITALGNDSEYMTSRSTLPNIVVGKLNAPINIRVSDDAQNVVWDAVSGAYGYRVKIVGNSGVPTYETVDTNSFRLSKEYESGGYNISVRALSNTMNMLSSDYSAKEEISKPAQVVGLQFNDSKKRYEWTQIAGITKYLVTYTYIPIGNTTAVVGSVYVNNANYYLPSKLGSYTQVLVQAIVSGSIAGEAAVWATPYVFNLFSSGEGTSTLPYIITTNTQFNNIDYYPTAAFRLDSDLTLTSALKVPFGGQFNGNGKKISGVFGSESVSVNEISIFGSLTAGAVVENLVLNNITVKGKVSGGGLHAGILASKATSATIKNITLTGSNSIQFLQSFNPSDNVYMGGLVGRAGGNSNVSGIVGSVSIAILCNGPGNVYIGGIVGRLDAGSQVLRSDMTFVASNILSNNSVLYVGGIAGFNEGTISQARSNVKIETGNYVGGIVGINFGLVDEAKSSGTIKATSFNGVNPISGYAGGIVGKNESTNSSVKNSYSTAAIEIKIVGNNSTMFGYAGGVVAYNNGVIDNCFFVGSVASASSTGNEYVGAIAGHNQYEDGIINGYYADGLAVGSGKDNGTTSQTKDYMKTTSFVNVLNTNAKKIIFNVSVGDYPIYLWNAK